MIGTESLCRREMVINGFRYSFGLNVCFRSINVFKRAVGAAGPIPVLGPKALILRHPPHLIIRLVCRSTTTYPSTKLAFRLDFSLSQSLVIPLLFVELFQNKIICVDFETYQQTSMYVAHRTALALSIFSSTTKSVG